MFEYSLRTILANNKISSFYYRENGKKFLRLSR